MDAYYYTLKGKPDRYLSLGRWPADRDAVRVFKAMKRGGSPVAALFAWSCGEYVMIVRPPVKDR